MLIEGQIMQSQIQKKILSAVERLPAFPKSVQEVLRLAQDVNCQPKDLVQVIRHDPIFTLKILKVVNSPFVGLLKPMTSIDQAVIYLGLNTLKNMALSLATIGALPKTNKANFNMDDFWLHSLTVALIARKLAALLNVPAQDQAEYFSAGLLHDIGKIIFALHLADDFTLARHEAETEATMLYRAERHHIGLDHASVGDLMVQKWDFPELLTHGIGHHHSLDPEMKQIAMCVFVANQISKMKIDSFAGENKVEKVPEFVLEHMQMDMTEMLRKLPNLDEELEKGKIFISA